jgi:hypothetical protein
MDQRLALLSQLGELRYDLDNTEPAFLDLAGLLVMVQQLADILDAAIRLETE